MSAKYQIDDIDRKILSHLVKNARIPFLEIARECGISGAAIHQRVKKMEDSGIIEGFPLYRETRCPWLRRVRFHRGYPRPRPHVQNGRERDREYPRSHRMSLHHGGIHLLD